MVDDDPLLREVAQTALELVGGWEVYTAQSGVQAQQRALAEHPDAILLDVMMPGVDGPSTVAALRADPAFMAIATDPQWVAFLAEPPSVPATPAEPRAR